MQTRSMKAREVRNNRLCKEVTFLMMELLEGFALLLLRKFPLSLGTSKQWVYAGRLALLPLMHDFPFVSVHEFTVVSADFQYCYELYDSSAIFWGTSYTRT